MGESWNQVVNRKNKKHIEQQQAMERIKDRYDDYYNDERALEMMDGLVETDVFENEEEDERLSSALKDMHNIPMNPHPPDPMQNFSQEEAEQMEKEYLENSYTTRSPWMRRAFTFNDHITFSKEDLVIPHYKEVPKDGVVFLDKSDHIPIRQGWGICLLGMFAGRFPGKEGVFQLMKRWKVKARVSFHRKGWMLFQFNSERDMEHTRQAGPFSQYGIPLILQPVPEKFKFDMVPEINIPVWIKLVDLEPYYWHENAIGKLASMVGVPIGADFKSLKKESMDWPRIQVIIDASKHPTDAVKARTFEGEEIVQKIEFEYIPKFCTKCKMFGHYMDDCKGAAENLNQADNSRANPLMAKDRQRDVSRMGRQQDRNRPLSRPGRPQPQQAKDPHQQGRNRSQSRHGRAPQQQTKAPPQHGRNRPLSRPGRSPIRGNQPQQNNNRSKSKGKRPMGAVRYGWAVQPTVEEIKKYGYQKNWLDAEGKVIIHPNTNYPFLAGRGFKNKRMDPQPSKPPQDHIISNNKFDAIANMEEDNDPDPEEEQSEININRVTPQNAENTVIAPTKAFTVQNVVPPCTNSVANSPEIREIATSTQIWQHEEGYSQDQHHATGEDVSHEGDINREHDSPIHGVMEPSAASEDSNADETTYIADLFNSPAQKTETTTLRVPEEDCNRNNIEAQYTPPPTKQNLPSPANSDNVEDQPEPGDQVPNESLVIASKVPTSSEKRMGRRQRERDRKRQLLEGTKRVTRSSSIPLQPEGCVPPDPKMVSK